MVGRVFVVPPDWGELQASIDGEVLLPLADGYEQLSRPFNRRFDQLRPQAVVRCASRDDVAEAVRFAREMGLQGALRSGGHGFANHASPAGFMIDVSPINTVKVCGDEVEVGAGTSLGHVYETLDSHGLTIAGGTCPAVGMAGLTLGGGLGILGRSYGLTSDRLTRADIVLADGRSISCSAQRHSDLFWALQGAGANNFGVVTSLTFDPIHAPTRAVNTHASWSIWQAASVIDAWQRWAPAAPGRLAASLKVTVPLELSHPPRVDLYATLFGEEAEADELLRQLLANPGMKPREVASICADYGTTRHFWAALGATEAGGTNSGGPGESGARLHVKSEFLRGPLPGEVIDRMLTALLKNRSRYQFRELDFMPWGGAYAHRRPYETAFAHRDETFLLKQSVSVRLDAPPAVDAAAAQKSADLWEATRPVASDRSFHNFADPDLKGWANAYYGENLERLMHVKARYDPDNTFRHAQSIPLP